MLDLLLACLHHLLIFAVFALLLCQFVLLKPGIDAATLRQNLADLSRYIGRKPHARQAARS